MESTATVPTDVDYDAVAVVVLAEEVGVDLSEAVVVHRADVHVAETSVAPAVDVGGAGGNPALIEETGLCTCGNRLYNDFTRVLFAGDSDGQQCALSGDSVEELR